MILQAAAAAVADLPWPSDLGLCAVDDGGSVVGVGRDGVGG